MGKKFITLVIKTKKHRLYTEDIQSVHQKSTRKVPSIPRFAPELKLYEEETEESYVSYEDILQGYRLNWCLYCYFYFFFWWIKRYPRYLDF